MEIQPFDSATFKVVQRSRDAFLREGYSRLTMTALADVCGMTRRALYQHFKSKEDLFRATLRLQNAEAFAAGDWAAKKELARGGTPLDVVTAWLDTRFGETRRAIARSPYGAEINVMAFEIGSDVMLEVSKESNARVAELLDTLCARKMIHLRSGVTSTEAAQLIADGARGVNQERPPIPVGQLAGRYRRMAEAILYGCAEPTAKR